MGFNPSRLYIHADILQRIRLEVAGWPVWHDPQEVWLPGFCPSDLCRHIEHMRALGELTIIDDTDRDGPRYLVKRLTHVGHEAMRRYEDEHQAFMAVEPRRWYTEQRLTDIIYGVLIDIALAGVACRLRVL